MSHYVPSYELSGVFLSLNFDLRLIIGILRSVFYVPVDQLFLTQSKLVSPQAAQLGIHLFLFLSSQTMMHLSEGK